MVKCIVFDFMGVVFKEGHIISRILHPLLTEAGKPVTYEDVSLAYMEYADGDIGHDEFWQRFFPDPAETYKPLERRFLETLPLDPDFVSIARDMKAKGYKLAALTHLPREWGNFLIQRYDFVRIFDDIFITAELRESKSAIRIYDTLLMRLGLRGDDCLFIDDMLENLSAASKLGFKTVWMKREEPLMTIGFKPDYVATSLRNLVNIVD